MKHRITTLPNGLRIVTTQMADAQSVTAQIVAGVGSRYEDFKVNGGVSHFLEHLLFKGTTKRPSAKVIAEEVDSVGGWNNAYTSNDITNYYIKMPHQHSELALDILADMVTDPLFDPEEVDRERNVIIEEMNVYRDDPARFVHELTPQLLWPSQPLGREIIGTEEVIRSIPRDDIKKYHQQYYVPGNMVVAVAGRLDHDAIVQQVTGLLGGFKGPKIATATLASDSPASHRTEALQKDTAQTHLVIGSHAYPYLHKDDPAAKVATAILGRGMSSRLFINVRERKGLAYSVHASAQNFVDTGMFEVYAGVNTAKTSEAIEAILEELGDVAAKKVAAAELTKAKNQIKSHLQMAMESNTSVADRLGTQMILLGKIRTIEETLADIEAVTAEDVQRVAADMLAPNRLRMGIITPDPEPATKAFERLTGA